LKDESKKTIAFENDKKKKTNKQSGKLIKPG
jgi:hypothetical protein